MFHSKDLMASVHPDARLYLLPDTCRISAADPRGQPECQQRSGRPRGGGEPPPPVRPPVCKPSQPAGGGGDPKPPRVRAAELALLRRELRAALTAGPLPG